MQEQLAELPRVPSFRTLAASNRIHELYKENQHRSLAFIQRSQNLLASVEALTLVQNEPLQYPTEAVANKFKIDRKRYQTISTNPARSQSPAEQFDVEDDDDAAFSAVENADARRRARSEGDALAPSAGAIKLSSRATGSETASFLHVLDLDVPCSATGDVLLQAPALAQLLRAKLADSKAHLTLLAQRVNDPTCRILVTGDLNAGKSTFVNALLRRSILPADQQPLTNIFTEVLDARHNPVMKNEEEVHAFKHLLEERAGTDNAMEGERFELGDLYDLVTDPDPYKQLKVYCRENNMSDEDSVAQPSVLVGNDAVDVRLIDSPGLNRDMWQTLALFARQKEIDVIVFVVSAENHFTLSSHEFLVRAGEEKAYIFVVINKFDAIKDKKRCKRFILQQIRDLSPHTYRYREKLVHFVSAEGMLNGVPSGVAQFLAVEQALKEFTLEKRSVSKLSPVKRYLDHLLMDIHLLVDCNMQRCEKRLHRLRQELAALKPREQNLNDRKARMLSELQIAIAHAGEQTEQLMQAAVAKLAARLCDAASNVPWRGVRYAMAYAHQVVGSMQSCVAADMNSCQIHAEQLVEGAWQEMARAHRIWFCEAAHASNGWSSAAKDDALECKLIALEDDPNAALVPLQLSHVPVSKLYPISFTLSMRRVLFPTLHWRELWQVPRVNLRSNWTLLARDQNAWSDLPGALARQTNCMIARIGPAASATSLALSGCSIVTSMILGTTRSLGLDMISLGLRVGIGRASKFALITAIAIGTAAGCHYMFTLPSHLPSTMANAMALELTEQEYPQKVSAYLRTRSREALAYALADASAKMDAGIGCVRARHRALAEAIGRLESVIDTLEDVRLRATCLHEEVGGLIIDDALVIAPATHDEEEMGEEEIPARNSKRSPKTPIINGAKAISPAATKGVSSEYANLGRVHLIIAAAPCATEMTALFNCWSTAGVESAQCKEVALSVSRCMASSKAKSAAKAQNLNQHLVRLQIPAVQIPRTYR